MAYINCSTGEKINLSSIESDKLYCKLEGTDEYIKAKYDCESNKLYCEYNNDNNAVVSKCDGIYYYNDTKLCSTHDCNIIECYNNASQQDSNNTVASDNSDDIKSVWSQLSFVDRYLSIWIICIMIIGVVVGYYSPATQQALNNIQLSTVSLPVAFGLWFMMYPVLVKVRYESFMNIFRLRDTYRQLIFSICSNWLIGPFIMLGVAWLCLPDVSMSHYRNGVIMVGLARCIAMVLIWNELARGDPEYCAILVVINSVLQIILYAPLALFFLVVISRQYQNSGFTLSYWQVFRSVLLFLGVPLLGAVVTRFILLYTLGVEWFNKYFVPIISPVALISLLWTIFAIFAIQGHNIVDNIGQVCRVAVPMVVYFCIMFGFSMYLCYKFNFGYQKAVTQAFTASSNNFELAIAVAAATFGVDSPEALAATIGPLVEVPVLLSLVYVALWLKPKLQWTNKQ